MPINLLASQATVADQLKAFQMGADDFVTKPFNVNKLVARVRAILRRVAFSEGWESDSVFLPVQVSYGADPMYRAAAGDA